MNATIRYIAHIATILIIFYDYLHLNREFRDLDFKYNLEAKEKLIQRAEALANEPNLNRVFRELQALHKIWKEDIGRVDPEQSEKIWDRFSKASAVLHERRQQHQKQLDADYKKNLALKNEIIANIVALKEAASDEHRNLQKQIKQLQTYRETFLATGSVPRRANQKTWNAFKAAVRDFNNVKNAFYKNVKQEENNNLEKKQRLVALAIKLKDNTDFEATTPKMKRIQADWKKIGHVPRKDASPIWEKFKTACNAYFDRLNALKEEAQAELEANYERKKEKLKEWGAFAPTGEQEADLATILSYSAAWSALGSVSAKNNSIEQEFTNLLSSLYQKLGLSKKEAELLKYDNTLQQLTSDDQNNEVAIAKERSFIRNKIEETSAEIRQLETNLQFFSNASDDNPLLQDVNKRLELHKAELTTWKTKLKKLNIVKNSIDKEAQAAEATESADDIKED